MRTRADEWLGGWSFEATRGEVRAVGRNLADGSITVEQRQLLNSFLTYCDGFQSVVNDRLYEAGVIATPRIKTDVTIAEKLRREPHLSLDTVRDLVGCRYVLEPEDGRREQRQAVARIEAAVADLHPRLIDRIASPKSGYRALHVEVRGHGVHSEIQVRTFDQRRWADVYEKLADLLGRGIRYGEGIDPALVAPERLDLARRLMRLAADLATNTDVYEQGKERRQFILSAEDFDIDPEGRDRVIQLGRTIDEMWERIREHFDDLHSLAGQYERLGP